MKVNSEGIYATKAVEPYQDGQVYYTAKGDYVYAFYIPSDESSAEMPAQISIPSFVPVSSKGVTMLGSKQTLKWKAAPEGGIVVTIPESLRRNLPCDHIWCLKIKVK